MKTHLFFLVPLVFCSCAGDMAVTRSSPPQPTRSAAISGRAEVRGAPQRGGDRYADGRIYTVTRPGTADQARGEWRAQGNTIHEWGTRIEFVELNSGRTIAFDAPHQITATRSSSGSATVDHEVGSQPVSDNPGTPAPL